MKTARRVFLILTIICGILAVGLDIAAICMQAMVAGENLLTMDSHWGYLLAVSYRWVTLAAILLTAWAAVLLTAFLLIRRKQKKLSRQTETPAADTGPAAQA